MMLEKIECKIQDFHVALQQGSEQAISLEDVEPWLATDEEDLREAFTF